jgi:hypothetical protein
MRCLMGKTCGAALASLLCLLGTTACNGIFGIKNGEPTGPGGNGGSGNPGGTAGTGGTANTGGTGGTTVTTATSTGGTGGGGPCADSPAPDGQSTLWVSHPVGSYVEKGLAVARQPGGALIVAGTYSDDDFVIDSQKLPYPPHGDEPGERENVFVAQYTPDGKPAWDIGFAGRDLQTVTGLAVDTVGNSVVAGYFLNTFQVGDKTLSIDGQYSDMALDGFVIKLSSAGVPLWAKQLGGGSTDVVLGVAADSQQNVIVLGASYLGGDVAMPPDSAPVQYGCAPRTLEKNVPTVFLTKLSPAGDCVWDKQYVIDTRFGGLYSPAVGLAVTVDPKDNIVMVGGFAGVANFGGGSSVVSAGGKDVFVLKASPDGEPIWSASFGDKNFQTATVVATDPSGDIWIGGNFQQSVTFDPLPLQTDPLADPDYWKGFVAKLELDPVETLPAKPVFLQSFADKGWQFVNSVATTTAGDAVFGGILFGVDGSTGVDFGDGVKAPPPGKADDDSYHEDGFIAKYCKSGGLRWSRRLSTTAVEEVHGVTVDTAGNTFATGKFGAKYSFGGGQSYTPAGEDVFTLKIGP